MPRGPLRTLLEPPRINEDRVIDLGGQTVHTFEFDMPLPVVYEYFTDIPSIFQFLPDVSDVQSYAPKYYRVIVGSSDLLGFNMAGVFDLKAEFEPGQYVRLFPATNGPAIRIKGFSFPGDMWLEATFTPTDDGEGTIVEYTIEIAMTIPLPGPLRKIPRQLLQQIGERAMSYKISNIISGFSRHLEVDFARYVRWLLSQQDE